MPRRPDLKSADTPRGVVPMRLSPQEVAALERVAAATGAEYTVDVVRDIERLHADRRTLILAALAPVRGAISRVEVESVLAAMNGVHLTREIDPEGPGLLGQHVALEVHDAETLVDGAPSAELARRLADLPLATRVALELWCGDLWRRHEDHDWWERELGWLSSSPEA